MQLTQLALGHQTPVRGITNVVQIAKVDRRSFVAARSFDCIRGEFYWWTNEVGSSV